METRNRFSTRGCALGPTAMMWLGIVCLFATSAAAQSPDDIMGFETATAWMVTASSSTGTVASSTTTRTQGAFAYQVTNPSNLIKVTSLPVASTAKALGGVGSGGSMFQLDLFVPIQQGNTKNTGAIQLYVNSPSRGLSKVSVAQISLAGFRSGLYNTIAFPISTVVRNALGSAAFNDLTFEFDISSPGKVTGPYLLDNLRVHSVPLVQDPQGIAPPPGYGGSVDLTVVGDDTVTESFALGSVQIPKGFHLKGGTTTSTDLVELKLGLDGTANLTCSYGQDVSDASLASYVITSCTGGFQAGDLVSSNWVSLRKAGGDPNTVGKEFIAAQLSKNALGDMAGAGLLPPMPTFWGNAAACIPAPVAGVVVTLSQSCADQVAQTNKILTDYFDQLNASNISPNWIVPPVPTFAIRRGDGSPYDNLTGPPAAPSDPPFDLGGHLNDGGTFDAYWRLFGNLTPTGYPGTDRDTTHFEATLGAHAVLFGEDVDVADIKAQADTDSGETTPDSKPATSTGGLHLYLFGAELPPGGFTVTPSVGFTENVSFSETLNLPPIQIWIFSITLGANVDAGLTASGSAAPQGADLTVTPSGTIGGHALGGVNIGVASGGVDAKVQLLKVAAPVGAQVKWVANTAPAVCALTLDGNLRGDLTLSSGGGEIDLDATFGVCPLCDTESETLFKWAPLASATQNLFNATIDTQLFGLPASMCTFPITVKIGAPANGATVGAGLPITLSGSAAPNDSSLPYTAVYRWTFTPGSNASSVNPSTASGASPVVTFGAPTSGSTSTWTINLSADVTVDGAGGTKITQTASATPVTITVSSLPGGVYITDITGSNNGTATTVTPDSSGVFNLYNPSGTQTIDGLVVGGAGTLNTSFSITSCTDNTFQSCSGSTGVGTLTTTTAGGTAPAASWSGFFNGFYQITMATTSNGSAYASKTVNVSVVVLQ